MNSVLALKYKLQKSGGAWLGALRSWLQWHTVNGDSVTWGSDEVIRLKGNLTQEVLQDICSDVAAAAISEYKEQTRSTFDFILQDDIKHLSIDRTNESIKDLDFESLKSLLDSARRLSDAFEKQVLKVENEKAQHRICSRIYSRTNT